MCKLTQWNSWSPCSSSCSDGIKTRFRNFREKKYRKQCRAVPNAPQLQQSINCGYQPCDGEDTEEVRQRLNHLDNNDEDEDYTGEMADGNGQEWLQVWERSRISRLNDQMETRFPTKLIHEVRNCIKLQLLNLLLVTTIAKHYFTEKKKETIFEFYDKSDADFSFKQKFYRTP